ncbi:hypothetical protein DIPPA_22213 [Diplonema papillatum]|nr:hypothetical protein DIPPA_22213 [Diplonema papillatum]
MELCEGQSVVVYRQSMLLFGGVDRAGRYRNDVWQVAVASVKHRSRVVPCSGELATTGTRPHALRDHAACVVGAIMVVLGGEMDPAREAKDGGIQASFLDLDACKWDANRSSKGNCPPPSISPAIAARGVDVYLTGGIVVPGRKTKQRTHPGGDPALYVLNTKTMVWRAITPRGGPAPAPRAPAALRLGVTKASLLLYTGAAVCFWAKKENAWAAGRPLPPSPCAACPAFVCGPGMAVAFTPDRCLFFDAFGNPVGERALEGDPPPALVDPSTPPSALMVTGWHEGGPEEDDSEAGKKTKGKKESRKASTGSPSGTSFWGSLTVLVVDPRTREMHSFCAAAPGCGSARAADNLRWLAHEWDVPADLKDFDLDDVVSSLSSQPAAGEGGAFRSWLAKGTTDRIAAGRPQSVETGSTGTRRTVSPALGHAPPPPAAAHAFPRPPDTRGSRLLELFHPSCDVAVTSPRGSLNRPPVHPSFPSLRHVSAPHARVASPRAGGPPVSPYTLASARDADARGGKARMTTLADFWPVPNLNRRPAFEAAVKQRSVPSCWPAPQLLLGGGGGGGRAPGLLRLQQAPYSNPPVHSPRIAAGLMSPDNTLAATPAAFTSGAAPAAAPGWFGSQPIFPAPASDPASTPATLLPQQQQQQRQQQEQRRPGYVSDPYLSGSNSPALSAAAGLPAAAAAGSPPPAESPPSVPPRAAGGGSPTPSPSVFGRPAAVDPSPRPRRAPVFAADGVHARNISPPGRRPAPPAHPPSPLSQAKVRFSLAQLYLNQGS